MKSRKWKKISALLFLGIALLFLLMPTYMQGIDGIKWL